MILKVIRAGVGRVWERDYAYTARSDESILGTYGRILEKLPEARKVKCMLCSKELTYHGGSLIPGTEGRRELSTPLCTRNQATMKAPQTC